MKIFKIMFMVTLVLVASISFATEKPSTSIYGYLKFDALYENGKSSHGNFAIWAADPKGNDGLFHATANQTRLGFKIKGISFGDFKVTGQLEIDFYGGNAENKAYNYMRHAFLKISDGSFSVIAGQYWDIINPLNPFTLNYPVLWGAGNMGYRRAQLSFRKDFKSDKSTISVQAGIFRNIASDYDGDGVKDGVASGLPMLQGRLSGKFSLGDKTSLQLGLSGHYAKSKGDLEFTSNSMNVDFLLVLSPKVKIIAEYFSGKNLGVFLGGIAQSVNTVDGIEVETKGFYVNLQYNLSKKSTFGIGYGMDDPDDDTLSTGGRAKNTSIFGNLLFKLSSSIKVGFELSNFTTEFKGLDEQKTLRIQNSWILSF
jgi:hypothetical protein